MPSSEQVPARNAAAVAERFSMKGRRALVTGGSVSLGREIAIAFADAGADVAIHFSRAADTAFGLPEASETTVAEIEVRGGRALAIEADFSVPGEARRCVREAIAGLGGLDVLVVCASVQKRTAFTALPDDEIDWQLRINYLATIELLQEAMPGMKQRQWGRVLTIGSINQTRPEPDLAIYASLKSAQHNLAINLAADYAPFGVTVNNLSPGLIATERNRWRRQDAWQWQRIQQNSAPMRRAGEVSEIAGAALLLCSEAGSFITGADLQATGGRHLGW